MKSPGKMQPETENPLSVRGHLAQSLRHHARRHRRALRRCRRKFSEQAVHDMRVETRRLLAHLDLLEAILTGAAAISRARRTLKKYLKHSAALRDAQVQVRQVEEMLPAHPALKPFHRHLRRRRRQRLRAAPGKIKGSARLWNDLKTIEKNTRTKPADPEADRLDRTAAGRALQEAWTQTMESRQGRSAGTPDSRHRTRIMLKKTRYMAEALAPLPDVFDAGRLKQAHAAQDLIGDIHDLELILARLGKFMAREKNRGPRLEPVRRTLRRRHAQLVRRWASTKLCVGNDNLCGAGRPEPVVAFP